jgi:hypothetical protein
MALIGNELINRTLGFDRIRTDACRVDKCLYLDFQGISADTKWPPNNFSAAVPY